MSGKSREIIEVLADVVKATAENCTIVVEDGKEMNCPTINYTFGSALYVKERLDELSQTPKGNEMKFPLIALFVPLKENRNNPDYYTQAKVNVLIAVSTLQQYSNEERLVKSFQNKLRPIYRRFLDELEADERIETGYRTNIPHEYSENYSYGRYGAHTGTGDAVSESIDAINLTNLEIKIINKNCRSI